MSSNNIYNILGKLNALTPQQETPKEAAQRIYESVEAKGSVLEGVKSVESKLNEKYMGFKAVEKSVKKGGAENPAAVAASIGRKKYGKKAFQKAAAAGKKMGESEGEDNPHKAKIQQGHKASSTRFKNQLARAKNNKQDLDNDPDNPKNWGGDKDDHAAWNDKHGVAEERETLKTKKGTIYKGGTYGTEYDVGDDGTKKPKVKAKDGEKKGRGRPKKEKPAEYTGPKGDLFGRTTGTAPKGKKGTVVKGKANQDTVDESANKFGKSLMESVNFKKMMDECNMTADEMLECINQDIQSYKATGDMSNRLRDFMHLHNHMKQIEMEAAPQGPSFAPQMPSGQDILPAPAPQKSIVQKGLETLGHPDDAEMLNQLGQKSTMDEELDELAQLAGISEGKKSSKADKDYDQDGEVESEKDEVIGSRRKAAGLDESSLSEFAKLAGIFQEGKDYGDVTINEPPTYDNTPDEKVMGVEVQTQGGDGEVAGKEKAMHSTKPTWKNADNALAETKEMLKPAEEFNFVKEMGRDLMQAYQGIKTK
jgi:hypothetical protein